MNTRRSLPWAIAAASLLGMPAAWADPSTGSDSAASPRPSPAAAAGSTHTDSASRKAVILSAVTTAAREPIADPLDAGVIDDARLASARGGSDTHTNEITATGTVSGNVASQLTTGSNTIGESAFANSSGIPIVIQNTGNNVLIQNSTILNLQLTSAK